MDERSLYRETFSHVRSSRTIRAEDFAARRPRHLGRRALVLAAVIALLAALAITAAATGFFGLRQWLLPEGQEVRLPLEPGEEEQKVQTMDAISMSGYLDTPESRALAEWQAFLAGYDTDHAILEAIGNAPTGFEEKYGLYYVYTQEMADKIEEITAKYSLKLHTRVETVLPSGWSGAVGDFLTLENTAYSGYLYENGTFACDGTVALPGREMVDYQLRRSVRGTFDEVYLTIDSLERCTEWTYATADGQVVTLALWPNKGLVLADLGDCFVTLNVLQGSDGGSGGLTAAELEAIADTVRFSRLSPVETPDLDAVAEGTEAENAALYEQPLLEEDVLYGQTGIETAAARDFVDQLSEAIAADHREAVAGLFPYPRQVVTPSGTYTVSSAKELLAHYDEIMDGRQASLAAELKNAALIGHDGLVGAITASGGGAWFCLIEDGTICLVTLRTSEGWCIQPITSGVTAGPAAYATAREAYAAALEDLLYGNRLPDGTLCDPYDGRGLNQFAVFDVDGDGAEELVLLFTNTYTAGMAGYVCAYDRGTGALRTQLIEFPMLTFYDNGAVTAGWSHNQGRAGDSLWPYTLYRYDAASDSYVQAAMVDAWSKDYAREAGLAEPFPEGIDRSGAGVVYYIMTDSYDPIRPVDAADYEAWRTEQLGGAEELAPPYRDLTEANIEKVRSGA